MFDTSDCEPFVFANEGWKRARKQHKCSACHEPILRGDRYYYHASLFDGDMDVVKQCARCRAMYDHLLDIGDSCEFPDMRLDCGHDYEEAHGEPPPENVAALAFATRAEMQAYAARSE
jgi:hypothetical protein